MSERTDWRISTLLREKAERHEEHSKEIGKILDRVQDKFEKDYFNVIGSIGAVLTTGGLPLALWKEQWILSGISIIMGSVLLIVAMLIRHMSGVSQAKYARTLADLERERAIFEQRTATLNHIRIYGMPEGTPLAQIQVLLGDSPTIHSTNEGETKWKSLPAENSIDESEGDFE